MKRILVTQSSMPPINEYIDEIRELWDTHWITNMGEKHRQLVEKLKDFMEVSNLELLTNGHMGLELSLQALNLKGEVITSPFTFASTTHAIVRNGLTPVFCDIDPQTYCIDAKKIESLITEKTCAILPIHVYGNICDVEEIERIADKYGLKVIYDACHTFGEKYKGISVGAFGDVSVFSFHATKVFNTIEGGAVCYKDAHFGELIYDLKNFGIHGPEEVWNVGANAKMNEFCAAMGICNLRHVKEEINKRKSIVDRYRNNLKEREGIKLNVEQRNVESNYAYFPVLIEPDLFGKSRNEVFENLAKEGIGARKYFYPITSSFECYKDKYDTANTPVALSVSKKVLTLPLYADLEIENVDRICEIVLKKD